MKGARCLMKHHDHQSIGVLFSAFPADIVNWRIYSYRNSIQSLAVLRLRGEFSSTPVSPRGTLFALTGCTDASIGKLFLSVEY